MSEYKHIETYVSRRALSETGARTQAQTGHRAKRGFTMTELLVVIAIIGVMAAIAFVSITQIQKNAQQLELDGTAKEIFIAAQNHLSEAEAQGVLARVTTAEKGTAGHDTGVYYFAVNGATDARLDTPMNMLNVMLPFGSIDSTVRTGGTYVIEYDFDTATVLGVFYARSKQSTLFGAATEGFAFTDNDYNSLFPALTGEAHKNGYNGVMIGWYGGEDASLLKGKKLNKPTLKVVNAERLEAIVTNPNTGTAFNDEKPSLALIIEGETSNARKTIPLVTNGTIASSGVPGIAEAAGAKFRVYLDDITLANGHFATNFGPYNSTTQEGGFLPGENIRVRAVAYSTKKLTNIARSSQLRRNSLFGSLTGSVLTSTNLPGAVVGGTAIGTAALTGGTTTGTPIVVYNTAKISNIRHLENLSYTVSKYNPLNETLKFMPQNGAVWPSKGPMTAEQTVDLSWSDFNVKIAGAANSVQVYDANGGSGNSARGSYMPVDLTQGFTYDGKAHRVTDVAVSTTTLAGGLFGTANNAKIHDLELVNFNVNASSHDAGTLAGTLTGTATQVTRVLAHNEVSTGDDSGFMVKGGNAGGLVGTMAAGTMSGCAAAVYVNATSTTGAAGGLVGSANATISYSYSGGHTHEGAYDAGLYAGNVQGATAGGLVGLLGGTVTSCYSTCSASSDTTAGGLVGSGGSSTGSYAIGSVNGEPWDFTSLTTEAFDANIAGGKHTAAPYDATLIAVSRDGNLVTTYGGMYPFKTLVELSSGASSLMNDPTNKLTKQLETHYGDWPAIVTLVVND